MREKQAQTILLIRAFEESDPNGLVLPLRERGKATRRALMVTGLSGESGETGSGWRLRTSEAVTRRARLLYTTLVRSHPAIPGVLRLAQLGSTTGPLLIGVALIVGLSTNALGFQREINLLSFPMLGLLGWNIGLYVVLALMALTGVRRWTDGLAHFLCEKAFRGALWRRLHSSRITEGRHSPAAPIIGKAVTRFGALWHRLAGSLLSARARRLLHLGAMAVMTGAVLGMYVRGLAFEYRATWESTWLDAVAMQTLLGAILGPAAAVLRVKVPDVAPLQGPEGSGDAALWIHLYAVTAVLFVILPRTALALMEGWRSYRLATDLPLDLREAYYRRMFSAWRGATRRVLIAPYSYAPGPEAVATLKTLLFDFFGARADVRLREALPYGAEPSLLRLDGTEEHGSADGTTEALEHETCIVVVFNAAQPPEVEVHGRFLEELMTTLDRERDQLLVVLDGSSYRDRVADPDRMNERRESWTRVVRESGLTPVPIDASRTAGAARMTIENGAGHDLMGKLQLALWPARDGVATS